MKLITIKDKKADMYTAPELLPNLAVAERHLRHAISNESQIARFANDFACYCIGDYNERTAKITPCEPILVIELAEIFKKEADK